MRLIDADKVKQYVLTEGLYCDTEADKKATASEIDKLFPTVEAIPIEWMKRYAKKICEDDGGRFNSKAYGINRMIRDWKEENGQ